MNILSRFEMERLTTPRLIAYRNSLLRCREGHHWDGDGDGIIAKEDDVWKRCYEVCLDILRKREHVKKRYRNKRKTSK